MGRGSLVAWTFAPEWLTLAEAAELSGYDEATLRWLVADADIDTREEAGMLLIDKVSLREFQEALLDLRALSLTPDTRP